MHAVATTIVFDWIPSDNLSDAGAQRDLKTCNVRELVVVSDAELDAIRSRYRILLAKYLFEHFPEFRVLQRHIPSATDCMYSEQTCLKSEVITMPILFKVEKKYSECVDVLDQLETWTYDIYAAAGMCSVSSSSSNDPSDVPSAPAVGHHSRPNQPASHIPLTESTDDPLSGVKIPCFGDQLTRVRLTGAKDLRARCHTARQRLDHLYPFCIVDWHTKRSFLKVLYEYIFKSITVCYINKYISY